MTAAMTDLLDALVTVTGRPLRPTPHHVMSTAEQAAEDYWAGVAETRTEERLMPIGRGDDLHRQQAYDNWLEKDAS